ncbi:ORF6N domain-containing protein [Lactiplantibacillus argentoratensis]|uniref:ORF6C domain-containing protein n=1 Tax=Lactiplantibacillus argentoratensis TaxID=271881 RepID=A0ABS5UGN1_9LACO|nr:ORF6C domain-containing protein [Lactiplantibacillus argentoratensis]MBT1137672.1 ORF6C domain-containing protein [Lactiplantibacillus argentoratensis]MBT1140530.1 ORF6C domain-containing protein [Lactiplantibacillus argentoratensis]
MQDVEQIKFNGELILTTEQLAEFYGATNTAIKQNFANNKTKFIEGIHYYLLKANSLKQFKSQVENFDLPINKFSSHLYLWTKRGASRHSKMLGTDRAWDMFDELEENYFNPSRPALPTSPRELAKLALDANEETNQRLDDVEDDLKDLKENQVIPQPDYNVLARRINQRVSEVSNSYGSITQQQRGELFKDINSGVKKIAGVSARSMLRKKDYRMVMDFVNDWEPSTATKTIIRQTSLKV